MKRRKKIILFTLAVLTMMVSVVSYLGRANAAMYGTVTPQVTVLPGGSISVVPVGMNYGSRAAGSSIPWNEGGGHYVQLTVDTNTTNWDVKVSKDQDLTSGSNTISSSNFKYTSVYVSGNPSNADVYSDLEFGTSASPSNVTDTPSTPAAASNLRVDVRYDLTIPATQPSGSYQATHTYTLTAS